MGLNEIKHEYGDKLNQVRVLAKGKEIQTEANQLEKRTDMRVAKINWLR